MRFFVSTMGIKGTPTTTQHDGSKLRIGIVHARWNETIIQALLDGAVDKLKELGVKQDNIVVQGVPGSFELPFACSKYALLLGLHGHVLLRVTSHTE